MKRIILISTLFITFSGSAQIIVTEDFEGVTMPALPAGWTTSTLVAGVWESGDAASANAGGFWPVPAHTQFAMANDDVCNCDMAEVYFEMPVQDFTGLAGVTLKYEYYDDGNYATAPHWVQVSTDAGANWTLAFTGTTNNTAWQMANYVLPGSTDGASAVLIRFVFSDGPAGNWGTGSAIDDIVLEVPASPYDAQMTYGDTLTEYTQVPLNQVSGPIGSQGFITSNGSGDVTGATMTVNVYDGTMMSVYSETSASQAITAGNIAGFSVAGYTPSAVDVYTMEYICSIMELDNNTSNDTTYQYFTVTDSTYARDMGTIDVLLGIGAGQVATLGNNYTMNVMDTMTTVSFYSVPVLGDTIKVTVYDVNAGMPNAIIGGSAEYIITAGDTSSAGMMLTLPVVDMAGNELILNAGNYYVGIEEYTTVENMALAQSASIFTPNTVWGSVDGGAWATLESWNFPGSFIVRPNFGSAPDQVGGLNDIAEANGLTVYPNPSAGTFNVSIDGWNADNLTIEVTSVNGQVIESIEYGKVIGPTNIILDLDVEAGTYFVRVSAKGQRITERIIVQK
jgi:hypothetical protein